jgi:hypothetical protein
MNIPFAAQHFPDLLLLPRNILLSQTSGRGYEGALQDFGRRTGSGGRLR